MDRDEDSSKRQKVESALNVHTGKIIDEDVFSQLPPEIQREIMMEEQRDLNLKGKGSELDREKSSIKEFSKCGLAEGNKFEKTSRNFGSETNYEKFCQDVNNSSVTCPVEGPSVAQSSSREYLSMESDERKMPPEGHRNVEQTYEISTKKSVAMETITENALFLKNSLPPEVSSNSNEKMPPDVRTNSNKSLVQSENETVPPDIDPVVFRELPREIQQELLKNWKIKQEFSISPSSRSKTKQANKQTLYKYFKKK